MFFDIALSIIRYKLYKIGLQLAYIRNFFLDSTCILPKKHFAAPIRMHTAAIIQLCVSYKLCSLQS